MGVKPTQVFLCSVVLAIVLWELAALHFGWWDTITVAVRKMGQPLTFVLFLAVAILAWHFWAQTR